MKLAKLSPEGFFVTSIPHTGTFFVRDSLLAGEESTAAHFWNQHLAECLDMMVTHRTIVPLRHPILVARSWKSRHRDLSALPALWAQMLLQIAPLEPAFLPLDSPSRDEWLGALNVRFGTAFETDWAIFRSADKVARVPLTDTETDHVVEMMVGMASFFNRWYESWPVE